MMIGQDTISIKDMVHTFNSSIYIYIYIYILLLFQIKTYEIVGVEVLRRVQGVICSMCCLDLNNDTTKILSMQFCYNEKLKKEKT